ncbi:hypothetical protein K474DRAFT_690771 [Panus rudis PR-1116 ss-1]|nr:hypothetical protein K474DRAFT_690771 [Panus rudis PR-1116 ss-1]
MSTPMYYTGGVRTLLVGIDIGNAFTRVAYSLLEPGKVPITQIVALGKTRIPSIVCYYPDGQLRSVGAEAATESEHDIQLYGLVHIEGFKVLMKLCTANEPTYIPLGKTAEQILADYLQYLWQHSRAHFVASQPDGYSVLVSLSTRTHFVLSHPNHWGSAEQSGMRQAMIISGLVPDSLEGRRRLHFVSEGQAVLHHHLVNEQLFRHVQPTTKILVIDAGSDDVQISAFRIQTLAPMSVMEITCPDAIPAGSSCIDQRAEVMIEEKLRGSIRDNSDYAVNAFLTFQESVKFAFRDRHQSFAVRFGPSHLNDTEHGISNGALTLTGAELADEVFQPTIDDIIDCVRAQQAEISDNDKNATWLAIFVGGLAKSPYLRSELLAAFKESEIPIHPYFPDTTDPTTTVATGALAYVLKHDLSTFPAPATIGVHHYVEFDHRNVDHVYRIHRRHVKEASGKVVLPRVFSRLVKKGQPIREDEEFTVTLSVEAQDKSELVQVAADILLYMGESENPYWIEDENENYVKLCTIRVDTSGVEGRIMHHGPNRYYEQEYTVILRGGLANMRAELAWKEKACSLADFL